MSIQSIQRCLLSAALAAIAAGHLGSAAAADYTLLNEGSTAIRGPGYVQNDSFDIALQAKPGVDIVPSATLTLHFFNYTSAPATVSVLLARKGGQEAAGSFSGSGDRWLKLALDADSLGILEDTGLLRYSFTITSGRLALYDATLSFHVGEVPEPAVATLMPAGLLALAWATRRSRAGKVHAKLA